MKLPHGWKLAKKQFRVSNKNRVFLWLVTLNIKWREEKGAGEKMEEKAEENDKQDFEMMYDVRTC